MKVRVKVSAASTYREWVYVELDQLDDIKELALQVADTMPNDAWRPSVFLEDRGYEDIESIEFGPFEPNLSNENWNFGTTYQ